MEEHASEKLTLASIAKGCNLSVSNLKRIFGLYSDVGIMKYFNSLKVRSALNLIDQGYSIVDITDKLGFSSTNYFHNVFKRETGMTPREYKAKNQINSN